MWGPGPAAPRAPSRATENRAAAVAIHRIPYTYSYWCVYPCHVAGNPPGASSVDVRRFRLYCVSGGRRRPDSGLSIYIGSRAVNVDNQPTNQVNCLGTSSRTDLALKTGRCGSKRTVNR